MVRIRAALVEEHPNIVVTDMEGIEGDAGPNEQGTQGMQEQGVPEDKEKLRPPPSKVRKRRTLHDLGKDKIIHCCHIIQ